MKIIEISRVDDGIKECIRNSKSLLEMSKKLSSDNFEKESTMMFYLALEEFGKAVLLRDKKKFSEYKDQIEIDTSDFFYDHGKKIDAAVRTIGPHFEIIKQGLSQELVSADDEKRYRPDMDPVNLIFIDYDPSKDHWSQKLSSLDIKEQNKFYTIFEKMLKKWDIIF